MTDTERQAMPIERRATEFDWFFQAFSRESYINCRVKNERRYDFFDRRWIVVCRFRIHPLYLIAHR